MTPDTLQDRLKGLPEAPEPSTELATEEKQRAHRKHRGAIEVEVHRALQLIPDVNAEVAADIVQALKDSRIPHVFIAY